MPAFALNSVFPPAPSGPLLPTMRRGLSLGVRATVTRSSPGSSLEAGHVPEGLPCDLVPGSSGHVQPGPVLKAKGLAPEGGGTPVKIKDEPLRPRVLLCRGLVTSRGPRVTQMGTAACFLPTVESCSPHQAPPPALGKCSVSGAFSGKLR